ncbi:hypothetical protein EDB83DRAFT_2314976 [Lactarius deliciosus]|nr:hypothetical protein EDB83DRAFT_2314976 [Lactarius deliciosus]
MSHKPSRGRLIIDPGQWGRSLTPLQGLLPPVRDSRTSLPVMSNTHSLVSDISDRPQDYWVLVAELEDVELAEDRAVDAEHSPVRMQLDEKDTKDDLAKKDCESKLRGQGAAFEVRVAPLWAWGAV